MNYRAEVSESFDLLEVHRKDPECFPFLLESVAAHPQSGRYDILFGFPEEPITGQDGPARLAEAFAQLPPIAPQEDWPYLGGWFLLLGYEFAQQLEPRLKLPPSPFRLPDFMAIRCTGGIIRDRETGRTLLFSETGSSSINYMKKIIQNIDISHYSEISSGSPLTETLFEDDPAEYLSSLEKIQEYLRAGDTFQVNLSRQWKAKLADSADYLQIYSRLRQSNPAPFAGLAHYDQVSVLSSSPERLVQVSGRQVQTRPIAGTRPRGAGANDAALQAQLIGNLKERAEHVMLIDLERNDLGRICQPGSIEVSELMALESYAHVHHIVSNVRGRLREGLQPTDVLSAVFPGGTITGCPKVRSMQIIAELEGVGRGPYTGSMGYLSRCGTLDTNILIRTLVIQDRELSFRAGAGIVADSHGLAELEETRVKARGMLLALQDSP